MQVATIIFDDLDSIHRLLKKKLTQDGLEARMINCVNNITSLLEQKNGIWFINTASKTNEHTYRSDFKGIEIIEILRIRYQIPVAVIYYSTLLENEILARFPYLLKYPRYQRYLNLVSLPEINLKEVIEEMEMIPQPLLKKVLAECARTGYLSEIRRIRHFLEKRYKLEYEPERVKQELKYLLGMLDDPEILKLIESALKDLNWQNVKRVVDALAFLRDQLLTC